MLWNGLVENLLFLYMWRQKWLCQHSFLSVTNNPWGTFEDSFCHGEADWEEAHLCYSTWLHLGGNLRVWFLCFESAKPSSGPTHLCHRTWGPQETTRCAQTLPASPGREAPIAQCSVFGKIGHSAMSSYLSVQVMREWGNSFHPAAFLK